MMDENDDEFARIINNSDDNGRDRRKLENAVEIPLALMFFSLVLGGAAIGNLIMYRTCVHLGHPVDVCRSFLAPEEIDHSEALEKEVQKYSTLVGTVKSVVESVGPAVLSLFLGGWSDKHGRKPLMVWPLLGMALSSMLTVVYSMAGSFGPWWIVLTIIPFTLTGGYMATVIGIMCYVSDISSEKKKGINFMIMQATIALAMAIGGLASSHLLKAVGIVYLLLIQASLYTAAYAFSNVFIKESMKESEQGSFLSVFDLSHAKSMFKTCFKEKPNYGRAVLLLIVGASTLSVFAVYGSSGLMYMYTRAKIQWTMKDYTTFTAVSSVISFAGAVFGIAVIQRILRLSDMKFIAISFFSVAVQYIVYAFATETWHMYLAATISMFGTINGPLVRSYLAKVIPANDMAKVFGLMGSADSVCPLLAPVIFNALYAATLYTFPASVMLLTSAVYALALALIGVALYLRWRAPTTGYTNIATEET